MLDTRDFLPACKADMATAAAVKSCDTMDGVEDGVLEDPRRCTFDPKTLVGTSTENCGVFTLADAAVIQKVWDGPRRADGTKMWYGLARGAPLTRLAGTDGTPLTGRPFRISLEWLRYFLQQDPSWDWTTLTPKRFEQLFDQSVEQYDAVIGTANPDLSLFRKSNGNCSSGTAGLTNSSSPKAASTTTTAWSNAWAGEGRPRSSCACSWRLAWVIAEADLDHNRADFWTRCCGG